MRTAFVKTLVELAERDPHILLLTADLGYMALEPFAQAYSDRFFNVGVAEQNMIGLATGLAESGFMPFAYSIVTFATLRPYEFIRNGPILHQLPVRIAGVGGGFEYGSAGPTHHGLEDVGVMRVQPGITVIAPADSQQTRTAMLATYDLPGPIYYRLGKDDRTLVPGLDGRFEFGRAISIREGGDLLFVVMGAVAAEVAAAAETLAQEGIQATVLVISTVTPAPTDDLVAALQRFPLVITVEAHYVNGGVGSLVAETVADHGLGCKVVRCGVRALAHDQHGISGSQNYFYGLHGLSRQALVETAKQTLHKVDSRRSFYL